MGTQWPGHHVHPRDTRRNRAEASLYTVDITGRNLRQVETTGGASDPAWSPLQE